MTWRDRLALLLGAASPFAATGPAMAAAPPPRTTAAGTDGAVAFQPLEFWGDPAHAGHLLQLAGHSSHRSHSSHSSHVSGSGHASHYSGSGVTLPAPPAYSPPAPVRPAAPRAATPATPATAAPSPRLSQDEISRFVQRAQIALIVKGYDPGPADGELSPKTREALRAFQKASGLASSGSMDVDTLHALGVLK
jgi:His-Xaa-Ser repeat protein HxsA